MSACKGAAGSHYYSIVDLTHPTHDLWLIALVQKDMQVYGKHFLMQLLKQHFLLSLIEDPKH